nr:carbohydrate sulfotransferase 11-like [Halyomorpha halys]
MRKLIWRKIVIPSFLLISTFILITTLKRLYHHKNEEIHLSQKELKALLAKAEHDNQRRIEKVEETCRTYNLGLYKSDGSKPGFKYPPTPQYSVYYFDINHNIAYCPVYKAASTTWLYNLCSLNGEQDENMKGKQISEVNPWRCPQEQGEEKLENAEGRKKHGRFPQCKRLICVRHPFDRILSAYRDKLESRDRAPQHGTLHYYKRWGSKIRNKFRTSGKIEPTFEEFVKFLIQTDLLAYSDDHWIPYNAYCTPCLLRYDYIAKVETLTEDQLFFINSQKLGSWISPSKHHSSKKISSTVARDYFSQLTKDQVNNLYQKYRLDFEMFDYSIQPYLDYAK